MKIGDKVIIIAKGTYKDCTGKIIDIKQNNNGEYIYEVFFSESIPTKYFWKGELVEKQG